MFKWKSLFFVTAAESSKNLTKPDRFDSTKLMNKNIWSVINIRRREYKKKFYGKQKWLLWQWSNKKYIFKK